MKRFYYNPDNNNFHPRAWCTGKYSRHSRELGDISIICPNASACQKYANLKWVHNVHPGSIYDFPIVSFKSSAEFEACEFYLTAQKPAE